MDGDLGKVCALRCAFAGGTNQSHTDVLVSGSAVTLKRVTHIFIVTLWYILS